VSDQATPSAAPKAATVDEAAVKEDLRQLLDEQSFADAVPKSRQDQHAFWRVVIYLLALGLSGFHLYTATVIGTLPSQQHRTLHVALGLGLIFLLYPAKRPDLAREKLTGWILTGLGLAVLALLFADGRAGAYVVLPAAAVVLLIQAARHLPWRVLGMPAADLLLSILAFTSSIYLFFNYETLAEAAGRLPDFDPSVTPFFVIGTIGVLVVLAAAQRAIGSALTVLAALMLVYAYLGQYMPGFLAHAGYRIDRIISTSFLGTEGVFGIPIRASATFIFLFLIFAAMLQRTGMERFFTRLAVGVAGGFTGGTAKVGVLTSAFSGTITGSSVANTVSNGAFTIPMMRRSGYKREFAGAVEAASSTGGQFAPPIMGAAAFIMIEITGIPYLEIIKAAAVPAILFFAAQFIVIHYESKKLGIRGLPRDQLPSVRRLITVQGYLLAPIILIFVILASGYTPQTAAVYAIFATIGVNILVQLVTLVVGAVRRTPLDPEPEPEPAPAGVPGLWALPDRAQRWTHRTVTSLPAWARGAVAQLRALDYKITLRTLPAGLVDAARIALPIIAACAAAGMITGVITLTGLGLKLVEGLLAIGQNNLYLVMFFVMISCLVLGIGVPTTANYVITATLAAPALIAFDAVPLLAAHMFVYYFGVMADITPPVCLAAYAAAGISGGNPIMTGVQSVRIAISGFLVPYMFVLNPGLLLLDVTWGEAATVFATALVGVTCLGAAVAGYIDRPLHVLVRVLLVGAGLSLLAGSLWTDVLGFGIFILVFGYQYWSGRQRPVVSVPAQA
jgi:TRAP transporter 4TM/12TM fusion protein